MRRRRVLAAASGAALIGLARAEAAWPSRPITLVVPFASGGIADLTARTVAQAMAASLGQAIVIDNRPSAGSIVGSNMVARASADGYTLLLMSNANAISVSLFRKLPFDPVADFVPISTLAYFDLGVFVASGSRFRALEDVVAQAKAHPGRLTIGSITAGSTQHLAAELFKAKAGVDMLIVPYKGTPAVLTALRAGEIDLAFEILGPMLSQTRAGVIRTLAVTSSRRFPALPQVPTVIEAGVPGYEVASWNALAAPHGTPASVIDRLHRAATQAIAEPQVRESLQALGVRAASSSPKQLESLLVRQIGSWGDVIRAAKLQPQ
ncbi:MAG: tripartite tricarboxylate transporter substrate binding protein [Pseudomonadota bacterium]|nr:tripartite tricarboxylate transporter substrate binding protein [Pseudomonadota bacterium]